MTQAKYYCNDLHCACVVYALLFVFPSDKNQSSTKIAKHITHTVMW